MPEKIYQDTKIMLLGQLNCKLWQKKRKKWPFLAILSTKKFEGGKILRNKKCIFNRHQVECFGPKTNHLCRKLYPQHESDTYIIIIPTEYNRNHIHKCVLPVLAVIENYCIRHMDTIGVNCGNTTGISGLRVPSQEG